MKTKATILIIEDEENIADFIETSLRAQNYKAVSTRMGKEGIALAASLCPDLILLDLGLPDLDGMEVIRKVREWSGMPVIVLSARNQEKEKVEALDLGADDYITKPVGTSELMARIRTALRHGAAAGTQKSENVFITGGLQLDFGKRIVKVNAEEVHLTQVEYQIVELLMQHHGAAMERTKILGEVWGTAVFTDAKIVDVNIRRLRVKIEDEPSSPQYIQTIWGYGYKWCP